MKISSIYNNASKKRPKITVPMNKIELLGQFLTAVGLVLMAVMFLTMYKDLPDIVPIHFDMAGNANDWASKSSLIFIPILTLVFAVGLTVLERFPQLYNYNRVTVTEKNAAKLYAIARTYMVLTKACLTAVFTGMCYFIFRSTEGAMPGGFLPFILICVGIILASAVVMQVMISKAAKE